MNYVNVANSLNSDASAQAEDIGALGRRPRSFVVGLDVGGTFTDAVCSDGESVWRAKAPTNPASFKDGVLAGCGLLATQLGFDLSRFLGATVRFGLGTTAVTNVLATFRGKTVGLFTTAGFEDHLHAMRGHRVLEDGWLVMPWNPVATDAVRGIHERIDRHGAVVTPLDRDEVATAARALVEQQGVDAFAVSFLWSVRNPVHERAAVETLQRLYPALPVFSGVELHPVMREYERTTLAVLNAFTADALDGVEDLETELRTLGLKPPVLLLHSGGGAITIAEARAMPISLASSGPAAGAVAAAEVLTANGLANALCCDMGGTSIDVAVIVDSVAERRQSTEIGGMVTGQSAIAVESIGAGGGSMAWIDERGLLRVGPQSARATPGPVCYGRGGTVPTVTDAMLLLGYLDPGGFMGGKMKIDVDGAHAACEALGAPIGLSAMDVAFGIREIALAEMGKAMRARISSGGIDVRRFGVVAFGGSGSLFAPPMALELGLQWVLTPSVASVLSAYGAASADIRRDRSSAIDALLPGAVTAAQAALEELRSRATIDLQLQGVREEDSELVVEVDLRFHRQRNALTLTLDERGLDGAHLLDRFRHTYVRQYGSSGLTAQTPVELSTIRVVGIGHTIRAALPDMLKPCAAGAVPPRRGARRVLIARGEAKVEVPVFAGEEMQPGHRVNGPALIDKSDTTLWAPAGTHVGITANGALILRFEGQPE